MIARTAGVTSLLAITLVCPPTAHADNEWVAEAYESTPSDPAVVGWASNPDRSLAEQKAMDQCTQKRGNACSLAGSTQQCMEVVIVNGSNYFVGFGADRVAADENAIDNAVAFYGVPRDSTGPANGKNADIHCSGDRA